jgi:acyl-CoA thioesterase
VLENALWAYRQPFDEVAGILGHIGVYHEKLRVELESRWPDDQRAVCSTPFPPWGDQADLVRLIDVQETADEGHLVAPGYHERTRNVVEGGQLLAQAIVAAAKSVPGQRVVTAHTTFPKAAGFDAPIDLHVDVLRRGRTFSTVATRAEQGGTLISPTLLLLDAGAPDAMRHVTDMPDIPGPYDAVPYDMRVTGRDLRIVDGAYSPDPDRVGPPTLYAWMRFRDNPAEPYLRAALLAQATTHWTVAAAMRPHRGMGEAQAHVTLSTGIMAVSINFHDDAPLNEWFVYATDATWSGQGLAQGDGHIFSQGGALLATYSVQAMVRGFTPSAGDHAKDPSRAM